MEKRTVVEEPDTSLILTALPLTAQDDMGDHLRVGLVEYVGHSVNFWKGRIKIGDRVVYRVHPGNKNVAGGFVSVHGEDIIDWVKAEDQTKPKTPAIIEEADCNKIIAACKEWYETMAQRKIVDNSCFLQSDGSLSKLNQTLHEIFGRNDGGFDVVKRLLKAESEKQKPKDHDTKAPNRLKELFVLQSKRYGDLVAIRSGVSKETDPLLQHCVCCDFYLAYGQGVEDKPAVAFRYEREVSDQEIEIINNARVAKGMRPLDKTTTDSKYWPTAYVNVDTGSSVYMALMDTTDLKFVSEHFVETPPDSDPIKNLLRKEIARIKGSPLRPNSFHVKPMVVSMKHGRKLGSLTIVTSQEQCGFFLAYGIADDEPVHGLFYVREANHAEIDLINNIRLREGLGITPRGFDYLPVVYRNMITDNNVILARLNLNDMWWTLNEFEAQDKECKTEDKPKCTLDRLEEVVCPICGENTIHLGAHFASKRKKTIEKPEIGMPHLPKTIVVRTHKRIGNMVVIQSDSCIDDPLLRSCKCGEFYLAYGQGADNIAMKFLYHREISTKELSLFNHAREHAGMAALDHTTDPRYLPAVYINTSNGSSVYIASMLATDLAFVDSQKGSFLLNTSIKNLLLQKIWAHKSGIHCHQPWPLMISIRHQRAFGPMVVIESQTCGEFYLVHDSSVDMTYEFIHHRVANADEIAEVNRIRTMNGLEALEEHACRASLYTNTKTLRDTVLTSLSLQDMQCIFERLEAEDQEYDRKLRETEGTCCRNLPKYENTWPSIISETSRKLFHGLDVGTSPCGVPVQDTPVPDSHYGNWAFPLVDTDGNEVGPIVWTRGPKGCYISIYLDKNHTIETRDFTDKFGIWTSDCILTDMELVSKIKSILQNQYAQTFNHISVYRSRGALSNRDMIVIPIRDSWLTESNMKKALRF